MAAEQDLRKIVTQIQKGIRKTLTKKDMLRLGKLAITIIQRRTRRGFGVKKDGGRRTRLKRLSPGYVARRKKATLSRFTSARKSNLTFTGQMLSAMDAKIKKLGSVTISFDKRRRDGELNQDIADAVSEARPFMHLSKVEIRALVESYDKTLQATIDKALRGL